MFIRKNKNRSGSVSIQICEKINRSYRVLKTVGIAATSREEELLMMLAKNGSGAYRRHVGVVC